MYIRGALHDGIGQKGVGAGASASASRPMRWQYSSGGGDGLSQLRDQRSGVEHLQERFSASSKNAAPSVYNLSRKPKLQ